LIIDRARPASGVVLVTGFEPFGGERTNPSWDIVERLPDTIAGLRVAKLRVPCEFRRAIEVAAVAIEKHEPSLVICLGQAGGRSRIGVERVAVNVDDARAPDNAGAQPIDEPIAADGPPAYFSTLPVKAMVAAMRAAGVPAELSNTAGTYVCNHLMYGVLHLIAATGRKVDRFVFGATRTNDIAPAAATRARIQRKAAAMFGHEWAAGPHQRVGRCREKTYAEGIGVPIGRTRSHRTVLP